MPYGLPLIGPHYLLTAGLVFSPLFSNIGYKRLNEGYQPENIRKSAGKITNSHFDSPISWIRAGIPPQISQRVNHTKFLKLSY